ncbi:MAG: PAS domain S-box protein, partial [Acidobacteriota bacterium]|nr:PAS domain S-box protein [Acidobacteriota bacterium]
EAFTTMLGQRAEDLIGTPGIDAVHPDDRRYARSQLVKLVDRTTDRVTLDVRFPRADGETVWTRFTVWHVLDPDGEPLYYASDVTDVTEVRAAREAEERAHRQLRFLLERSADAVVVLDADGQITYVSPASEHVFGRAASAVVGQHVGGSRAREQQGGDRGEALQLLVGRRHGAQLQPQPPPAMPVAPRAPSRTSNTWFM